MNKPLSAFESKQFILAGKALVTMKSLQTNKHFTYLIVKKKHENIWFVKCMYEYQNQKYNYLGCILPDLTFIHTKASQSRITSPSWQAFNWAWTHLDNKKLEVFHEGKCGRCGRLLTEPESITTGYGPICRKLITSYN